MLTLTSVFPSALWKNLLSNPRVLGVDPGTYKMGVAVIEKENSSYRSIFFDTLEVTGETLPSRLHQLFNELSQVIKIYRPQALVVENVFVMQTARPPFRIGE